VWLAIPVGLLAASLSVWNAERAANGAEWSPFVRRRQRIDQHARDRKTARLLARPRDNKLTAPALGVALDGDLRSWRQGRYVVPPAHLRGKAMAVVGAPGAGKTVTLLRLAHLAGVLGRKVCFADCKGTDPTLVPGLIAAYLLGRPGDRVGCWPEQAMDMWRGTPTQIQSRLLAVEQFTEPFYQRVASAGLRLASCCAASTLTSWPPSGKAAHSSSKTSRPSATTSPGRGSATPTSSPPSPAPSTAAPGATRTSTWPS
jgi:hypothetical protein